MNKIILVVALVFFAGALAQSLDTARDKKIEDANLPRHDKPDMIDEKTDHAQDRTIMRKIVKEKLADKDKDSEVTAQHFGFGFPRAGWGLGFPGVGWGLGFPGVGWGLGFPGFGFGMGLGMGMPTPWNINGGFNNIGAF